MWRLQSHTQSPQQTVSHDFLRLALACNCYLVWPLVRSCAICCRNLVRNMSSYTHFSARALSSSSSSSCATTGSTTSSTSREGACTRAFTSSLARTSVLVLRPGAAVPPLLLVARGVVLEQEGTGCWCARPDPPLDCIMACCITKCSILFDCSIKQ